MKRLIDMTEPELFGYFNALASTIETLLPAEVVPCAGRNGRCLFALLVFDDPGIAQYVSNAQREDIIKAMRECADRLERREVIERTNDGHP